MQFSAEQMQMLEQGHVQARARHWQSLVDAALPPDRRADPAARLDALSSAIAASLGPRSGLPAQDLAQATQWLHLALQHGATWRETRAAAVLHASCALGALWFVDPRLLSASQQLALQPTLQATMAQLLGQPQGQRFKAAALRERQRWPGLRLAWLRAAAAPPDEALQDLLRAATAPPAPPAPAQGDLAADETPDLEEGAAALPEAARAFMAHEQRLLQQAGLADPVLARLCLAGDLLLGLGRCVRLAAVLPPDVRETRLKEAIDAAAGLQR